VISAFRRRVIRRTRRAPTNARTQVSTAANQAVALEGRGQELADLYTALIAELEGWSRSHPEAAAEALKKYGD
jgi:hypothetical protein